MNSVGRILLIGGAIVLALLVGVIIGRSHQAKPIEQPAASGVQISTEAPPTPPPTTKLPTVPEPPPPAAPVVKVDPNRQVEDDAAAVGMTTRHSDTDQPPEADQAPTPPPADAPPEPSEPQPN